MRQQPSNPLLVMLAYVSFISLGLPDGLLGVAWPSMRGFFHLPLDALGTLLVMFTTGYLLSSCSSGRILARINVGSLLTLSCLATAASLLGYAADAMVGDHRRPGGSVRVGCRGYRCWGEHLRRHALQHAHGELAARLLWYRGD